MDERASIRTGWALQERISAPKFLICYNDQFIWECQCSNDTESGVDMAYIGGMRLNTKYTIRGGEKRGKTHLDSFRDAWQCIATVYSARLLSLPGDKLPAISGFSRKFSEVHRNILIFERLCVLFDSGNFLLKMVQRKISS
jgi:hypothetical protein